MSISDFLAELRRRRVFRVAAVYLVVGWMAVEVVSTTSPLLQLPDWTPTLVLVLLLVGFPIAVLLAWAFELTSEGVRRTAPMPAAEGSPATYRQTLGMFGLGILVALVAFGGYASFRGAGEPGEPGAGAERSIAVLPFDDMSPGGDQAFFSDGITEDILTKLAAVPSCASSAAPRSCATGVRRSPASGRSAPRWACATSWRVASVGRETRSASPDSSSMRGPTSNVWAESYDRNATDVFAVQSEIAREIARQLEIRLTPELNERLAGRGTSPEVYELYLKALSYYPEFAPAWAALARAYRLHDWLSDGAGFDSATAFAERAIALDPGLADGYAELGQVYVIRGEDRAGRAQIELALELNANHAESLRALAGLHLEKGRLVEALDAAEGAIGVDPNVYAGYDLAAWIYVTLGIHDRAEEHYRIAFEQVEPHPLRLECVLGWVDFTRGDTAAALDHMRRMHEVEDAAYGRFCALQTFITIGRLEDARGLVTRLQRELPPQQQPLLSFAYLAREAGDAERSAEFLEEAVAAIAERTRAGPPNSFDHVERAGIAALRGRPDEAVRHLMAARSDGFLGPNMIEFMPWFSSLRDHPEVRALLHEHEAKVAAMRAQVSGARPERAVISGAAAIKAH